MRKTAMCLGTGHWRVASVLAAVALFLLGLPHAAKAQTFSNAAGIAIPLFGNAAPYPSDIPVAGLTGTVTDVNVALNGFSHTFPEDVDVLLVGPAGQRVIIMSDAGGDPDAVGLNLGFDDEAAGPLPAGGALMSGTFTPTNHVGVFGPEPDVFGPPAPGPPYAAALSTFDGTNPNGNWSLFVVDDCCMGFNGSGNIASWSITLTLTPPPVTGVTGPTGTVQTGPATSNQQTQQANQCTPVTAGPNGTVGAGNGNGTSSSAGGSGGCSTSSSNSSNNNSGANGGGAQGGAAGTAGQGGNQTNACTGSGTGGPPGGTITINPGVNIPVCPNISPGGPGSNANGGNATGGNGGAVSQEADSDSEAESNGGNSSAKTQGGGGDNDDRKKSKKKAKAKKKAKSKKKSKKK